jgi:DNA repair protein RadC
MSSLRRVPPSERPRERLCLAGPDVLSLQELLAILLATGTKGKSVLMLAQEMLTRFGGLQGLLEASVEELVQVKGIGAAKAILLKAAFEIALRASKIEQPLRPLVDTAEKAFALVHPELAREKREVMIVILKDVKGRLIHYERVAVGTLSEVLVHPREVFFPAVRHKAHSLIAAHNHPSGDPTPSRADIALTTHLLRSGKVMGIALDDHLIIGGASFVSLRRRDRYFFTGMGEPSG